MAISSYGGNIIGIDGWSLTKSYKDLSGTHVYEFRGRADKLEEFLTYIAENYNFDTQEPSIDEITGVATVRLTNNLADEAEQTKPEVDEIRLPTCSIQGAMNALPLHQHPSFNSSEGGKALTIEAIVATDYCLKNYGQVTSGDLQGENEAGISYAQWRLFGIDTYLAPTYVMTLTFYLKKKSGILPRIKTAGEVFKFDTVLNRLPKKIQPPDIGVNAWLAQAPSISQSDEGITVSQQFIGAKAFPSFYTSDDKSLLYNAPALPDGKWSDSKYQQASSGTQTQTQN